MDHIFYLLFTIGYIGLLLWGLKGVSNHAVLKWTSVIYLIVVALTYDNAVLAIGNWIGEGQLLKNLNLLRYWLHAFMTPLLVLYSVGTLRESGVEWAKKTPITLVTILYTLAAIAVEISLGLTNLQLHVRQEYGVLSFAPAESNGPPVMILLVTAAMLIASANLWKKTGWAVFFFGVVIMTIGSAIPFPVKSNAFTNLFELLLLTSLMWTKRKLNLGRIHVKGH